MSNRSTCQYSNSVWLEPSQKKDNSMGLVYGTSPTSQNTNLKRLELDAIEIKITFKVLSDFRMEQVVNL